MRYDYHTPLVGKRFGQWTVTREPTQYKGSNALWFCRCSCGTERWVSAQNLTTNKTKSCGCWKAEKAREFRVPGRNDFRIVPKGKQFGYWKVLNKPAQIRSPSTYWFCKCKCGTTRWVRAGNLLSSISRSCGCWKTEQLSKPRTHGATHKGEVWPEYWIWDTMIARCTNPKCKSYPNYGGRGIKVAKEFMTFEGFINYVGRRPNPKLMLDRIDNDGDYEPGNVRWTTASISRLNQRDPHAPRKYRHKVKLLSY